MGARCVLPRERQERFVISSAYRKCCDTLHTGSENPRWLIEVADAEPGRRRVGGGVVPPPLLAPAGTRAARACSVHGVVLVVVASHTWRWRGT